jgi:hypothetical protein
MEGDGSCRPTICPDQVAARQLISDDAITVIKGLHFRPPSVNSVWSNDTNSVCRVILQSYQSMPSASSRI